MVFSSSVFLFLFLPAILIVYSIVPRTARNGVLLSDRLFFYAWGETLHLLILIASVLINYSPSG